MLSQEKLKREFYVRLYSTPPVNRCRAVSRCVFCGETYFGECTCELERNLLTSYVERLNDEELQLIMQVFDEWCELDGSSQMPAVVAHWSEEREGVGPTYFSSREQEEDEINLEEEAELDSIYRAVIPHVSSIIPLQLFEFLNRVIIKNTSLYNHYLVKWDKSSRKCERFMFIYICWKADRDKDRIMSKFIRDFDMVIEVLGDVNTCTPPLFSFKKNNRFQELMERILQNEDNIQSRLTYPLIEAMFKDYSGYDLSLEFAVRLNRVVDKIRSGDHTGRSYPEFIHFSFKIFIKNINQYNNSDFIYFQDIILYLFSVNSVYKYNRTEYVLEKLNSIYRRFGKLFDEFSREYFYNNIDNYNELVIDHCVGLIKFYDSNILNIIEQSKLNEFIFKDFSSRKKHILVDLIEYLDPLPDDFEVFHDYRSYYFLYNSFKKFDDKSQLSNNQIIYINSSISESFDSLSFYIYFKLFKDNIDKEELIRKITDSSFESAEVSKINKYDEYLDIVFKNLKSLMDLGVPDLVFRYMRSVQDFLLVINTNCTFVTNSVIDKIAENGDLYLQYFALQVQHNMFCLNIETFLFQNSKIGDSVLSKLPLPRIQEAYGILKSYRVMNKVVSLTAFNKYIDNLQDILKISTEVPVCLFERVMEKISNFNQDHILDFVCKYYRKSSYWVGLFEKYATGQISQNLMDFCDIVVSLNFQTLTGSNQTKEYCKSFYQSNVNGSMACENSTADLSSLYSDIEILTLHDQNQLKEFLEQFPFAISSKYFKRFFYSLPKTTRYTMYPLNSNFYQLQSEEFKSKIIKPFPEGKSLPLVIWKKVIFFYMEDLLIHHKFKIDFGLVSWDIFKIVSNILSNFISDHFHIMFRQYYEFVPVKDFTKVNINSPYCLLSSYPKSISYDKLAIIPVEYYEDYIYNQLTTLSIEYAHSIDYPTAILFNRPNRLEELVIKVSSTFSDYQLNLLTNLVKYSPNLKKIGFVLILMEWDSLNEIMEYLIRAKNRYNHQLKTIEVIIKMSTFDTSLDIEKNVIAKFDPSETLALPDFEIIMYCQPSHPCSFKTVHIILLPDHLLKSYQLTHLENFSLSLPEFKQLPDALKELPKFTNLKTLCIRILQHRSKTDPVEIEYMQAIFDTLSRHTSVNSFYIHYVVLKTYRVPIYHPNQNEWNLLNLYNFERDHSSTFFYLKKQN